MNKEISTTYQSFHYLLCITLNVCLGAFCMGYMGGVTNLVQINLKYIYGWSSSEANLCYALLGSLINFSAMISSFLTGAYLLHLFSRRFNLIIADIACIFGNFLMVIVAFNGFPQLFGRFLCGLNYGINITVIPAYINEISPVEIRGELTSHFNTMILLGVFFSYVLSIGIPSEETLKNDVSNNYWMFVLLFVTIPAFIRIISLLFYFNFEPAPYLIKKQKHNEALEVINTIYKPEFAEQVLNNFKALYNNDGDNSEMSYRDLFRSKYKTRVIIGIILVIIQTWTGINAVISFAALIFTGDSNDSDLVLKLFYISLGGILISGSYLSGQIIDKYGRRPLLLWGAFLLMIELFIIFLLMSTSSYSLQVLIKFIFLLYFFTFGVTLSPVIWVFAAEILNDKGLSLCGVSVYMANVLLSFFFPFAISTSFIQVQGTFLIFSIIMLFSYYYIYQNIYETKGKCSEEIDALYGVKKDGLLENITKIELTSIKNDNQ